MTAAVASGHAEAAHRGERGPPPGPRRPGRGGRGRGQQVRLRGPRPRRRARHRQHRRAPQQVGPAGADPGRAGRRRRARRPSSALPSGARGDGDLLALCIDAARARATVGEMSDAMEEVFGRHKAEIRRSPASTARPTRATRTSRPSAPRSTAFAEAHGRRPRMLVVKMGQDGHDRGRQGHRHRLRRPRLRRRRRPAVPDAGRSGPGRRRERRPRGRRVQPGRRAQDPRAPAHRRSCRTAGADEVLVVVRRRHPAARPRHAARAPAWPPSSARRPTSPRPRHGPRPARARA